MRRHLCATQALARFAVETHQRHSTIARGQTMLTCFAVSHTDDDQLVQSAEHEILQAIADEAEVSFEPGFAGKSYLDVPTNADAREAMTARLEQNDMSFSVVTRIAY
ncbi:hypothetical protein BG60_02110 [Caballeronia zhejiangensis]|jgi:hypothetical protein|uniref:Uncharacterized protein n=2 Tax=Burkholderiaceae TaxID=119060 RepID=A0A656QW21_9BURK|nr:hypothetical protein BURK_013508 [Burkholderia sp. SJ98]KDR33968.1 hypothetical protein BG60_02110 [Caballeronia zhejiangensis]